MIDATEEELVRLAIDRANSLRQVPASTYRIQLHKGFSFADATAIIPYLSEIGITHIYTSPYLKAVAGSTHGYDVIDHSQLNPELGNQENYDAFLNALAVHQMSHILDTVPNHMGVDTNDNAWWNDVLRQGSSSAFGHHFDIDWQGSPRTDLRGRVLLPILGEPYGEALEQGKLQIKWSANGHYIQYYNRHIPLSASSCANLKPGDIDELNGVAGQPRSFDRLDALLALQHYRLASWKTAPQEINYRRFFDINSLAALSIEREEVFEQSHAFTLSLLAQGKVAGLRIDHPDGLYDPAEYLQRLQIHFVLACAQQIIAENQRFAGFQWWQLKPVVSNWLENLPSSADPLYVAVEKILAMDEPLPSAWRCDGTSGYDFLSMANGLFVNQEAEGQFTNFYRQLVTNDQKFEDLIFEKKLMILDTSMSSELHRLSHSLARLAQKTRIGRDFTAQDLRQALRKLIASFPVYRSYISNRGVSDTDVQHIEAAVARARERTGEESAAILNLIRDLLLQHAMPEFSPADHDEQLRFAGRFQQLTSPVMAKGVEDTAFYIYQRFISLNEVGGDPARFGTDPDHLHRYFIDRAKHWPNALNPLSTHDTKRSEDVRARLNVLSEMPEEWISRVKKWMHLNVAHKTIVNGVEAPSPDEEYLIYQTIVGAWPVDPDAKEEYAAFIERVCEYLVKATRETKMRSSWTSPNKEWESAGESFVRKILDPQVDDEFSRNIREFLKPVIRAGLKNSLAQTLLRLTAPGVPDTYQGTELWDFSLVDPDNRRPVRYKQRTEMVRGLPAEPNEKVAVELLEHIEDGRAKLWLTQQVLKCRRQYASLFARGSYVPLHASGDSAGQVFAFARSFEKKSAIILIPRMACDSSPSVNCVIEVPEEMAGKYRNILTGEFVILESEQQRRSLSVAGVLSKFSVALLLSEG